MQLRAGGSILCPLPHARTAKEARSLGSRAGKERSKKRAQEKRWLNSGIAKSTVWKSKRIKSWVGSNRFVFSKLRADTLVFKTNWKLKLTTSSKEFDASLLSGSYIQTAVSEHFLSNSHSVTYIGYLSQLKHLDMNAIVSGKHARRTSFGKPKPSNLWEWTNVTNYNHYVIFNFFLGLFFLAASPYHVIPCNFRLLFYRSIYSVYSCFFLINLIKNGHSRNIVYLSLFHVGWSVFAVT